MIFNSVSISAATARRTKTKDPSAASKALLARKRSELLELDVEKLLMITEALWTILKEQHGYSDDDLADRIAQIDMRDGKLDGKVAKEGPEYCPKCQRTLMKQRPICMYCGTALATEPFKR